MHLTDFLPAVWAAACRDLCFPGNLPPPPPRPQRHLAGRGLLPSVEEGRGPLAPQMPSIPGEAFVPGKWEPKCSDRVPSVLGSDDPGAQVEVAAGREPQPSQAGGPAVHLPPPRRACDLRARQPGAWGSWQIAV